MSKCEIEKMTNDLTVSPHNGETLDGKGNNDNDQFPLYDVPWLVREPNGHYSSKKRHEIEVRNQAVVDDYFILRDRGASAEEARETVAEKHEITPRRVYVILIWFYKEAEKRRKYDFLEKFSPLKEHIS